MDLEIFSRWFVILYLLFVLNYVLWIEQPFLFVQHFQENQKIRTQGKNSSFWQNSPIRRTKMIYIYLLYPNLYLNLNILNLSWKCRYLHRNCQKVLAKNQTTHSPVKVTIKLCIFHKSILTKLLTVTIIFTQISVQQVKSTIITSQFS